MSSSDSDNINLLAIKFGKVKKRPADTDKNKGNKRVRVKGSSTLSSSSPDKGHQLTDSEYEENERLKKAADILKDWDKGSEASEKSQENSEDSEEEPLSKCKINVNNRKESRINKNEASESFDSSTVESNNENDEEKTFEKIEEEVFETNSKDVDEKNQKEIQSSSSDSEETLALLRADKPNPGERQHKETSRGVIRKGVVDENLRSEEGNKQSQNEVTTIKSETVEAHLKKSKEFSKKEDVAIFMDSQNDSSRNIEVNTGPSKTVSKTSEESHRFKRLKRLATVAGLRFKYKQLEGIKSESKKCRILKDFMVENGITRFTLKDCKEFRVKKEEEAELAELSKNQIIGADSTKRVTRGSHRLEESVKVSRKAHLSTSSSDNASEREEMIEENRQIFSRLRGIVSDESD